MYDIRYFVISTLHLSTRKKNLNISILIFFVME